jgi:hypothetical protein
MKLSWDDWGKRCTVDVDDVSAKWTYSALLSELTKLNFIVPALGVHNDNLLYMMGQEDERDDTAWVAIIDMDSLLRCSACAPSQITTQLMVLSRQMSIVTTVTLCKVTCFVTTCAFSGKKTCFVTTGAFSNTSGDERRTDSLTFFFFPPVCQSWTYLIFLLMVAPELM